MAPYDATGSPISLNSLWNIESITVIVSLSPKALTDSGLNLVEYTTQTIACIFLMIILLRD